MEKLTAELWGEIEVAVRENPDAMVSVVDEYDIIRYASISALELFGYAPSEIVGRRLSDFFDSIDTRHLKLIIQDAILNGESISTSRHVKLKYGGTKCMEGPARGFVDLRNGRGFALAIGRPCKA